jgi:hypothetical protein
MPASARNCVPARILIPQDREKCGAFVGIGRQGGGGGLGDVGVVAVYEWHNRRPAAKTRN